MEPRLEAELEVARQGPEDYVRALYRLVLRREPEPDALARSARMLADGTLSRATLLSELVGDEEFGRVRSLDDAVAYAAWARGAGERPRGLRAPHGDERPIEIAWCLSRYRGEPALLDAGYAFAEPAYQAALVGLGADRLVGVDLARAEVPGLEQVEADLRRLPFATRQFDVVLCISTIEHVGLDNERYGIASGGGGLEQALGELRRVGRRLLITVPCGEPGEHGWFVQDEPDGWRRRFRSAGFLVFEEELYELGDDGWRSTELLDPLPQYGARGPGASAVLCAELHPRTPLRFLRQSARSILSR
ncbi:MAG: methyltransferase domain-containing protein [Gaiellaceae bacterium]